jgi:hypothetical protein
MKRIVIHFLFLYMSVLYFFCTAVGAEPFRADVIVEETEVFTGEPFTVQIQISGSEHPERPDLSDIPGFAVAFRGGQQNSSSSVTIINGRMTQNVRRGYVFSYEFTPQRTGRITIPSITVHSDGQTVRTHPASIYVREPVESDSFKLRINVSKTECYVGEPVILTVTWYLGEDVRNFRVKLPLLEKKDFFTFVNPRANSDPNKQYYRIPLKGGEVIGEKGRGTLDGRDFATLSFQKVLIPKKAGDIVIRPATIACEALAGYERRRSPFGNDFFSDFFHDDFFGMGRNGVYRKVVVPSNSAELHVSKLPAEGRPENFSGNVGDYKISAEATPTEVSVGDPITLKIALSGPDYLEEAEMPPLQDQPGLLRDFKIPTERAVGEISGKSKIFTQTIRPLRNDVTEIPPIALPYFDTRKKAYKVVRTEPIPIHVKEARILTALDAEGSSVPAATTGSEVETWSKGIAYNYEDTDILKNQIHDPVSWLVSFTGMGVLILPPLLYFALLGVTLFLRRRNADPLSLRAKKAGSKLEATLKHARTASSNQEKIDIILGAFKQYLGDKLRLPAAALTFNDVRDFLKDRGVEQGTFERLKSFFETCEAERYAGNSGALDPESLIQTSLTLMKQLNRYL